MHIYMPIFMTRFVSMDRADAEHLKTYGFDFCSVVHWGHSQVIYAIWILSTFMFDAISIIISMFYVFCNFIIARLKSYSERFFVFVLFIWLLEVCDMSVLTFLMHSKQPAIHEKSKVSVFVNVVLRCFFFENLSFRKIDIFKTMPKT